MNFGEVPKVSTTSSRVDPLGRDPNFRVPSFPPSIVHRPPRKPGRISGKRGPTDQDPGVSYPVTTCPSPFPKRGGEVDVDSKPSLSAKRETWNRRV